MNLVKFGSVETIERNLAVLSGPFATKEIEPLVRLLAGQQMSPENALFETMKTDRLRTIPPSALNKERAYAFVRAAAGPDQSDMIDAAYKGIIEVPDAQELPRNRRIDGRGL